MATYVYETVPRKPGAKTKRFEVQQSMKDAPLKKHPETGEPVRRVIVGGFGFIDSGKSRSKAPAAKVGHSCGAGCGCGHSHN
ncbi:MAG TPA: zinc ribbon domain-containing protein [Opitutaceae bacterium]